MARVTYGPEITELAGSIGGVTFQKNASGNIARLRSKPTVNPTSLQAGYQRNIAYLISYWHTISQPHKILWDNFALAYNHFTAWGEEKTLSGYQWFLSINLIRYNVYATVRETPPLWAEYSPPDQFTIETNSTYIRAAWSPDYEAPGNFWWYCSLPLRQSSLKLRRSLFLCKYVSVMGTVTNYDLTPEIEKLFNVTWADFYASANCHIIIRGISGIATYGMRSFFTSAITKIN